MEICNRKGKAGLPQCIPDGRRSDETDHDDANGDHFQHVEPRRPFHGGSPGKRKGLPTSSTNERIMAPNTFRDACLFWTEITERQATWPMLGPGSGPQMPSERSP
jgi:hypothetical protein